LHWWPVARVKLFGREPIDATEEFVQEFSAVSFANLIEATTQGFVCLWTDEEWLSQCAEVETSAADEERDVTTTLDLFDLCHCFAGPFDTGVVDVGRDEVDQVMWDASSFIEGNFGGPDFDLLINLNRITVDYLAVYFEGDIDSEFTFA
jgi:hypothetical protein